MARKLLFLATIIYMNTHIFLPDLFALQGGAFDLEKLVGFQQNQVTVEELFAAVANPSDLLDPRFYRDATTLGLSPDQVAIKLLQPVVSEGQKVYQQYKNKEFRKLLPMLGGAAGGLIIGAIAKKRFPLQTSKKGFFKSQWSDRSSHRAENFLFSGPKQSRLFPWSWFKTYRGILIPAISMAAAATALSKIQNSPDKPAPWVNHWRRAMGLTLISLGVAKLYDTQAFAQNFGYDLIARLASSPNANISFIGESYRFLYPVLQVGLGVSFLLEDVPRAAYVAGGIMAASTFTGSLLAIINGIPVGCACGGVFSDMQIGPITMAEEGMLLGMSLYGLHKILNSERVGVSKDFFQAMPTRL